MIGQGSSSLSRADNLGRNKADFATLLAFYRQQSGLSREQLAQASNLSRIYLYQLEHGQRRNPSPQTVRRLAQALTLGAQEREQFYRAYTFLTGRWMEEIQNEEMFLDPRVLSETFVSCSPYPTHTLDRFWFIATCNAAATHLFGLTGMGGKADACHALEVLFAPFVRQHLLDFDVVARRLVHDFCVRTQCLAHLPTYKALWKRLQALPDFSRLAATRPPGGASLAPLQVCVQHSHLGRLTLRVITTRVLLENSQWMISYLPDDQHTLDYYRQQRWYAERA